MSAAWDHQIKPYHQTDRFSLYEGDCRSVLPIFANCSVDSVVCDPPYELGFMGKGWDRSGIAYDVDVWRECLRVLKPGGHLLAFGGSRTYHRLACAIEDAGFEIRDQIQWIYGSGFPKSLDVSKAIDAASGAATEVTCGSVGPLEQHTTDCKFVNLFEGKENE
jgi:DNA modification methylase